MRASASPSHALETSPMTARPDHIPAHMLYRFADGVAVPTKPRGDARRFRPLHNSGVPAVVRGTSPRAYPEACERVIWNSRAQGTRRVGRG